MKIVRIGCGLDDITVYPDSAMGRDTMPLFLPDGEWLGYLYLAFRLNRLGKNVREKFALRYVEGISVALVLDSDESWICMMDNAVIPGTFLAYDPDYDIVVNVNDGESIIIPKEKARRALEKAIAEITTVATVKTGDIILCHTPIAHFPLIPNTRVVITLNYQKVMNLKVK